MHNNRTWTTAGAVGAGLIAGQAQGAIVDRSELDFQFSAIFDTNATSTINYDAAVDLLPIDPGGKIGFELVLQGDLVSQSSLENSTFGISRVTVALNTPDFINTFDFQYELYQVNDQIALPFPEPAGPGPFSGDFPVTLDRLASGDTQYVLFSFDDGLANKLYGFFGVSMDRVQLAPNLVQATFTFSDFAYDDDPTITSMTIAPPNVATIPGDTDGDGDIDDADLGTAFSNYTGPLGAAGGKAAADGDTDGDGDVDDADLANSFSGFTGPLTGPASVPEPASLAALAAGLVLAGGRRRDS